MRRFTHGQAVSRLGENPVFAERLLSCPALGESGRTEGPERTACGSARVCGLTNGFSGPCD